MPSLISGAVHKVVHRLCTWAVRRSGRGKRRGTRRKPDRDTLVESPGESQGAAGNLGPAEPNPRRPAGTTRHPQVDPVVHRALRRVADDTPEAGSVDCPQAGDRGGVRGLTLPSRSAYRWPVGQRMVPVDQGARARTGDRTMRTCRPRPVVQPSRKRRSREQADVPAEQPSSSQDARVPPADAHPRGPGDPLLPPPQGPQEPRGLSAGLTRCSPPPID